MTSTSLSESSPIILSQAEWSALNDAISNFHSVLHGCSSLDAERKIDLLGPVLKQLSSATAPINERLSDEEGGGNELAH